MEANYVHKDSTTLVQDETGAYIEIPRNRITFKSKDAEIIFDLTLENDELRLKNQGLKEKIKKLSQWDTNKDTRNSRQRVANAKLLKENQELKKQVEEYKKELETADNLTQICILKGKEESEISYRKCLNILDKKETQQKEFIKFLEDESKEIYRDGGLRQNIFKQILQKYKEIIGVSDENN